MLEGSTLTLYPVRPSASSRPASIVLHGKVMEPTADIFLVGA